ncbi:lipopolysaccharide biosynthesis protein [Roseimaritima ulvae]|uniref:Polysaccharide biosynthesis protein n=1 Tax=Roseimaritima ulvae TaxID=980254 RepID=A0A5B9QUQ9_9BACT|nr:hypothetical protein [Roseimaritima ulvae]QEG41510.1 Polysaccharide biosynthesis protein [Roseimaritima ulvae]
MAESLPQPSSDDDPIPWLLIGFNLVGIGLGYAITMLLARQLTHSEFEHYVAAVATLGLWATFAEAGFGKYALRIVPVYLAAARRHLLRSYIRYALVATLWLSMAVALVASLLEWFIQEGQGQYVILVAISILPIVALCGVMVDLLLAMHLPRCGMFVGRVLVPATTLALIVWTSSVSSITPLAAIYCFAGGSAAGLLSGGLVCTRLVSPVVRKPFTKVPVDNSWRAWTAASFSFMGYYFLLAWLSRSTLFIASHLPHQPTQLAVLAPAMETGCLILLLSKSTDKYFQPAMSMLLESTQWQQLSAMGRSRRRVIGICVAVFLAVVMLLGKQILGLYGEDFVPGYGALCIVAVGSSVWTMFSLSPSFLLYSGGSRILLALLCIHAIVLVLLVGALFPAFGAIGGAAAYAITVSAFTLSAFFFASTRFGRLSASTKSADHTEQQRSIPPQY